MAGLIANPSPFEAALEADFTARSAKNEAQAAAFDRFAKLRLPNRRVEGWKWSDMNAALRSVEPGERVEAEIKPSAFAALDPLEFRIINGRIELPDEPISEGLRYGVVNPVATISELENHPMASLNVALARKALGFEVSDDIAFERPVLIRHINNGAGFSFAQTMMRISPGARLRLIETYEGEGAGFYSHLFHMVVRDGAEFRRAVWQDTGEKSVVNSILAAKIDEKADFQSTGLSTGSRLSRHECHAHFWGAGSSASINSAALVSGERHSDFTTDTQFRAEGCDVVQLHKGVAKDRGRNVFQGKFHVFRDAQKTDAKMAANALLLSDGAEANHKPELEIYADDVECAHGSTVGALDEDALFYLRQRGLDEAAARALLIEAFVGEVVEKFEDEALRDIFASLLKTWLENNE
ncbi:Fe-S cluster assembly protein SufD [Hyphococcus sp.]|jgi:Fe-S cluster assembly protein SufD|uniref:Fe-S cluster assembly protein SufD n=1 Tax=Hyphococcus sp. TaxID=2038636 RepID=UPI003D0B1150